MDRILLVGGPPGSGNVEEYLQELQSRESRETAALLDTAYFHQACCELAFQPADLCASNNLRLALARARALKQSRETAEEAL